MGEFNTPFPCQVFPPDLERYATEAGLSIGGSRSFVTASMLAVLSTAAGTFWELQLKADYTEKANLFLILLGDPSTRKSPIMKGVSKPLDEEQERWWDEGRQVLVSNSTMEALRVVLKSNPRGVLMLRDELTQLIDSMNEYKGGSGGDRQDILSAWSRAPIVVNRVDTKKNLYIKEPYLSILGGMTPSGLHRMTAKQAEGDGFRERWLIAYGTNEEAGGWTEYCVSPEATRAWESAVGRLLSQDAQIRCELSPCAKTAFIHYIDIITNDINNCDSQFIRSTWAKYQAYLCRFILLLHAADMACGDQPFAENQVVETPVIERAWQILEYFRATVNYLHMSQAEGDAAKRADKALAAIRKHGMASFSQKELFEKVKGGSLFQEGRTGRMFLLEAALTTLVQHGWIKEVPVPPKRGRPSRQFLAHPKAFEAA